MADHPAEKKQKEIPLPVKLAREALDILKTENIATEGLEKLLPAFAINLHKTGSEVTLDILLDRARAGDLNLKIAPEQWQKTYEEIAAKLPPFVPPKKEFQVAKDIFEAAQHGDLEGVKKFLSKGVPIDSKCTDLKLTALQYAAAEGHLNVTQFLVEKGACMRFLDNSLMTLLSMNSGDAETARYLIKKGEGITGLRHAIKSGHTDLLRVFIEEKPAEVTPELSSIAGAGYMDLVELLIESVDEKSSWAFKKPWALKKSLENGHIKIAKYLIEQGATPVELSAGQKELLKCYDRFCALQKKNWEKEVRTAPPQGLEDESPFFFRPQAFHAVRDILIKEGCSAQKSSRIAFRTAALFGTEERVLQYLEKWGTAGKQPLHDITRQIKLPSDKTPEMDLTSWADAVLKCGPSMAKLAEFSDRVLAPEKSDGGRTWSMVKTREKAAPFAYTRGTENPALAAVCMEHAVREEIFSRALDISKKVPARKNIPDITIDGEKFGIESAKFYRLPANDVRGLFLGEMTDCCQSISDNDNGESCAKHGYKSENGGFYVVEKANGKIVSQAWAWRGKEGELVFDSIETLGNNVTGDQWKKITKEFTKALKKNPGDVTAFHIGTGSGTPGDLVTAFKKVAAQAVPRDHSGYRDSKDGNQILVWKKKPKP